MNFKKIYLLILFLTFNQFSFAQIHQEELEKSIQLLDQSLLEKNVNLLSIILHENLTLGHSNGWIESKESLLQNLPTSQITYDKFIQVGEPKITFTKEDMVSLRRKLTAKGSLKQKNFEVDLKILEIWIKNNQVWQLLSRQSVEVDFD